MQSSTTSAWIQSREVDELPDLEAREDEGEMDLEAASGADWRDQLSAEVSALEEVPHDHDYI